MPGSTTTFQLMCRPYQSLLALPVNIDIDPISIKDFPNFSSKDLVPYAHIMKCNFSQTIDFLHQDIDAINTQYEIDKALYNQDKKYVNLSIDSINSEIATLLASHKHNLNLMDSLTENIGNLKLAIGRPS